MTVGPFACHEARPQSSSVRLALEPFVVGADRLVEDLWGADAVRLQRNTLQSKMAKLRRALGDPPVIVLRDGGYRLETGHTEIDAHAVLEYAAEAPRLLDAGEDDDAVVVCQSGLDLYRGDVLQAAGNGSWVEPHRAKLDETLIKLKELQFTARLRLGQASGLIGELEAAVAAHPFREGLWELLITSLYRDGRQADALAAYQRVRAVLADQLGLDPGPRLRHVEQQVLEQDATLHGAASPTGLDALQIPPGNLPSLVAELIGRDADVEAVCDLLLRDRLVEIVGPGGVGKTAVAIAVGRGVTRTHQLGTGGIWIARLETAVTANDVVDAIVAAINVPGGEAALAERLRATAGVLILDNCEHVIDTVTALSIRLLDGAHNLRILCTSQVSLDVEGSATFELAPLALLDSVALFTRRANAQRLNRPSSEIDAGVLDLCRSLDGLPLAIELAAARTKTLSIEDITRRLDDRLNMLSDPASRRPERRRSLRSTIQWSYELLFPDDKRGLWALATFAGGAPLSAVEYVVETLDVPSAAAIDVVGRLASRSLVTVDDDGSSTSATTRYRLLDSIRVFALEAMADAGLSEPALAAHAAWFAEAARSSTAGVRSARQAEYLAFARAERANIDAALAWAATHDPSLALEIVNGFGWSWVVLGDSRGAERIVTALEAIGDRAPRADRANAMLLAGWIEASTGHLDLARNHIVAAADLAEVIDDGDLLARSAYYLAYVVSHHGDFAEATALTDRSRALYDGLDRAWDQAASELFAARAAISAGDEARSLAAADRVQHWLGQVDDPWLHVRGDAMLGELARLQRRFAAAVIHIARAAETSGRLGFAQTEAYQVASLGRAQCQAGDYDAGIATLDLAIAKAEACGDARLAALARVQSGRVLRAVGQLDRARDALERASAWHVAAGGGEQAALGECLLAAMDAGDGVAGAEQRLVAILHDASGSADAHIEVFALDALARIAAESGDGETAQELVAKADLRMESASHFITELDRVDRRQLARSREETAPETA